MATFSDFENLLEGVAIILMTLFMIFGASYASIQAAQIGRKAQNLGELTGNQFPGTDPTDLRSITPVNKNRTILSDQIKADFDRISKKRDYYKAALNDATTKADSKELLQLRLESVLARIAELEGGLRVAKARKCLAKATTHSFIHNLEITVNGQAQNIADLIVGKKVAQRHLVRTRKAFNDHKTRTKGLREKADKQVGMLADAIAERDLARSELAEALKQSKLSKASRTDLEEEIQGHKFKIEELTLDRNHHSLISERRLKTCQKLKENRDESHQQFERESTAREVEKRDRLTDSLNQAEEIATKAKNDLLVANTDHAAIIDRLEKQISNLQETESAYSSKSQECQRLTEELSLARDRNKSVAESAANLEEKLQLRDVEKEQLSEENARLFEEKEANSREHGELTADKLHLTSQLERYQQRPWIQDSDTSDVNAELERLRIENSTLSKENTQVAAEKEAAVKKAEELEQTNNELRSQRPEHDENEDKTDLEQEKLDLQQSNTNLQADKDDLAAQVANLEREKFDLQQTNTSLQNEKDVLAEQVTNVQEEKAAQGEAIWGLEKSTSNLEQDKSNLQQSNANIQTEKDNLLEQVTSLQQDKVDLQSAKDGLSTQLSNLQHDKVNIDADTQNLTGRVNDLQTQLADANQTIATHNEQTQSLHNSQTELENVKREIEQVKDQNLAKWLEHSIVCPVFDQNTNAESSGSQTNAQGDHTNIGDGTYWIGSNQYDYNGNHLSGPGFGGDSLPSGGDFDNNQGAWNTPVQAPVDQGMDTSDSPLQQGNGPFLPQNQNGDGGNDSHQGEHNAEMPSQGYDPRVPAFSPQPANAQKAGQGENGNAAAASQNLDDILRQLQQTMPGNQPSQAPAAAASAFSASTPTGIEASQEPVSPGDTRFKLDPNKEFQFSSAGPEFGTFAAPAPRGDATDGTISKTNQPSTPPEPAAKTPFGRLMRTPRRLKHQEPYVDPRLLSGETDLHPQQHSVGAEKPQEDEADFKPVTDSELCGDSDTEVEWENVLYGDGSEDRGKGKEGSDGKEPAKEGAGDGGEGKGDDGDEGKVEKKQEEKEGEEEEEEEEL